MGWIGLIGNGLVNGMSIYMFVYITRRLTRLPVSGLTVVPCLDRNGIVLFIVLCSSLFCGVQQCVFVHCLCTERQYMKS